MIIIIIIVIKILIIMLIIMTTPLARARGPGREARATPWPRTALVSRPPGRDGITSNNIEKSNNNYYRKLKPLFLTKRRHREIYKKTENH